MENKSSKKVTTLRIVFAVVTVAYIVGMILLIYVFGVNPSLKLQDKITLLGIQLSDAKYISLEQIFFCSLPVLLFIFSLALWLISVPKKNKK